MFWDILSSSDCVCVSLFRTGTLLYTRPLSRATPTLSTCCFSTEPRPTSWLWSVHQLTHTHMQFWMLFVCHGRITSCCSVTGQNGNTALSIACRLGYISVVDTLRPITDENLTAMVRRSPPVNMSYTVVNTSTRKSKLIFVLWIFSWSKNLDTQQ